MREKFLATLLIVVLFIIGLAAESKIQTFGSQVKTNSYTANVYSPSELAKMIDENPDKYAVIDVRSKVEYDMGHLPGAIHADYHDTEALKKAAGDKIPVAYCAFSAMRGPYAAYQLHKAGFANAALLDGGISAWAEDIQGLESSNPQIKTIFNHPKNIFPNRILGEYPKGQGSIEFNIIARRFEFEPSEIKVRHGQRVTINIMSVDVTHGFALPEFGIEEELLPNEATTVTFIADRKGNFPFVCSVICGSGHNHASMVGNLIIE